MRVPSVNTKGAQRKLSNRQTSAFYHDQFVTTQVEHFSGICIPCLRPNEVQCIVDVGGGHGFFSRAITSTFNLRTRVIDQDRASIEHCRKNGVDAICGDALNPPIHGDESVVCFNLILHHLVADSEQSTARLQEAALEAWRHTGAHIYVNEYIYDSYIGETSGKLIYAVTKSFILSSICKLVAKVVPSLKANTFGVGVRFRGRSEWVTFFESRGWCVVAHTKGEDEYVSLPRRMLLIASCRRDSFLLQSLKHS